MCILPATYLVLVCALLELFQLIVKHSELLSDALYPSMQTPVLTVLSIEIIFIPLTLIWRGNHSVFPVRERRDFETKPQSLQKPFSPILNYLNQVRGTMALRGRLNTYQSKSLTDTVPEVFKEMITLCPIL